MLPTFVKPLITLATRANSPVICDRLWDIGPYGGTWAKLGFLHNLTCSYVLSILVNFLVCFQNSFEVMSFQVMQPPVVL